MPERPHTLSPNGSPAAFMDSSARPVVVAVDHVSMVFNMASQQLNNLKEYLIAIAKRELMFKEFKALDDVSFEVRRGDVFGILGTNGSGKSTMLKIIAGVLEPTEGSVRVTGSIAPLIELGAGFDHELTARENIYLNGALLGYPKRFIEKHFDEIVAFAEIEDFLDIPLKNYSSGMIARIAFAIATVIVPDILIVDEVLSVGDFMFQQKCEQRIQELINQHGVTVLIVSHSTAQIERLCNKAIWIEKSHTRMIGSAADVCRAYQTLAGHKGDARSEKAVFDLLLAPVPGEEVDVDEEDSIAMQTLAADDKYGTAARVLKECAFPNEDTVVVVAGDNITAQVMGTGLAGALRCPLVMTRGDAVARKTYTTMINYAPCSLIVLSQGGDVHEAVVEELAALGGGAYEVIEGATAHELSAKVADRIARIGKSDGSADPAGSAAASKPITCRVGEVSLLAEQAATIYRQGIPILIDEDGEQPSGAMGDAVDSAADVATSEAMGGTAPYLPGAAQNASKLVFASSVGRFDCCTAGIMAAVTDGELICMDHNDLDDIVRVMKKLAARTEPTEAITFIGGDFAFTTADKELIAKVLTHPALVEQVLADEALVDPE